MNTAAIYVRVSTADQHVESQLYDLRELASRRSFEVVKVYPRAGDEGFVLPPPQVVEIAHQGAAPRKDKMMSDRRARRAAMSRRLKQALAAKRKAKEAHSKPAAKATA